MYQRIALAIAFSPRVEALICEAKRMCAMFNAHMVLIHIGPKTQSDQKILDNLLEKHKLTEGNVSVVWENGDPAKKILSICKKEKVDLLIAGALKKENFLRYYIGSVARRILRKAECSVLMFVDPSKYPKPFRRIVIHASEDKKELKGSLTAGVEIGKKDHAAQLHVLKEIKLYGLHMAVAVESSEEEYSETRKKLVNTEIEAVQNVLNTIETDNLRINIKVAAGKSGHELSKFATRVEADLLVVEAPNRKLGLFDRVFPHDLEILLADLPCNVLIHHS